mgnify:CR=1 FL=1
MSGGFTPEALERYSRQILLPGVGGAGQRRLAAARVVVVGSGGLGCPALQYLAAAGVGRIDIIDSDVVELSNLNRQVLHSTAGVGRSKAESAAGALRALNPQVDARPLNQRLDVDNANHLLSGSNVVLDGTDNFRTRYTVADTCAALGIPLVSGSLFRFEGQLALFPHDGSADSPCYRCLYPQAPPPGTTPSCAEAGILGPVAGLVGSLMATEALKLLLRVGEPLAGRLLVIDALAGRFDEFRVARRPACPHHSPAPKD